MDYCCIYQVSILSNLGRKRNKRQLHIVTQLVFSIYQRSSGINTFSNLCDSVPITQHVSKMMDKICRNMAVNCYLPLNVLLLNVPHKRNMWPSVVLKTKRARHLFRVNGFITTLMFYPSITYKAFALPRCIVCLFQADSLFDFQTMRTRNNVIEYQDTMGYLAASNESRCRQWTATSLEILRPQYIVSDNYFHCLKYTTNSLQWTWQIYIPDVTEEMRSLIRKVKGDIYSLTFLIMNMKQDVYGKSSGPRIQNI